MFILTRKMSLKLDLVFNFGYDMQDLNGLSCKDLQKLKLDLMAAMKIATIYGKKIVELQPGKCN